MKRWFVIGAVMIMALAIAACGGEGTSPSPSASTQNPTQNEGQSGQQEQTAPTQNYDLSFATATSGGTGYMYAVGVSTVVNKYVDGMKITPFPTAGVIENDRLLRDGDTDLIIHTAENAYYSYKGEGNFESPYELLALWPMYASYMNIVVNENSGIQLIKDLKGKRIGMGAPGSSANAIMTKLLEVNGITENDYEQLPMSLPEQVDALKDGTIDAITIIAGNNTPSFVDLAISRDVRWVPVDKQTFDTLASELPPGSVVPLAAPANMYNNQTEEIHTVGTPLWAATDSKLDDNAVKQIISAFFEHFEEATEVHPIVSETTEDLVNSSIPPIPWHPAAEQALKDAGFKPIPHIE